MKTVYDKQNGKLFNAVLKFDADYQVVFNFCGQKGKKQ
jgi:hypothetical protein